MSAQNTQNTPFVLKWGIISTGGIATNFSKVSLGVLSLHPAYNLTLSSSSSRGVLHPIPCLSSPSILGDHPN